MKDVDIERIRDSRVIDAAPEEVWKLVFDPARHPEWRVGVGAVDGVRADGFVLHPEEDPALAVEHGMRVLPDGDGIVISCLESRTRFSWRLTPAGAGTRVDATIDLPEARAGARAIEREHLAVSLARLADAAREG